MKRINAIMLFGLLMAPLFNSAQNHDLTTQEYTRLIAALSPKDKAYVEEVLFRDYEKSYKERFLTQDTFVHTHFRKDIKNKIAEVLKEIFNNNKEQNKILSSIKNHRKDLKQKKFLETFLKESNHEISSHTSQVIDYFKSIYEIKPLLRIEKVNWVHEIGVGLIDSVFCKKLFRFKLSSMFFDNNPSPFNDFIIGHEMAHIKYGHDLYRKLFSNNPSRSKLDVLFEKQADIHTASLSLELARQYRQVAKDWLVNDLKLFGVNRSLDPILMDEQPGRAHITHLTRYCLATELLKYKEQEEKWLRSPEGDAKYGTVAYEKMWDRWCEKNK